MNNTFSDMSGKFVLAYLDDILIYSNSELEYLEHMQAVLYRLRDKKFRAKYSKCEFVVDTIKYLGHIINKGKVSVDPAKIEAIRGQPVPTCVKEV